MYLTYSTTQNHWALSSYSNDESSQMYLFPRDYAIATYTIVRAFNVFRVHENKLYRNYRIVRAFSVPNSTGPAPPSGVGEMRSNGTFLFTSLCLRFEHARLTRTSQCRFGAGVFLVSAKKGVIIYPGDFFQRRA